MENFSVRCVAENWGYKSGDIVLLSDGAIHPRQIPTRQNILDAMRWLVRGAKPHDSLFFHCKIRIVHSPDRSSLTTTTDSGHGGQTKDLNGDELDGHDEGIRLQPMKLHTHADGKSQVIFPVDFKKAGHIIDDVRASA